MIRVRVTVTIPSSPTEAELRTLENVSSHIAAGMECMEEDNDLDVLVWMELEPAE